MSRRRVILESPYGGQAEDELERNLEREENVRYAQACLRDSLERGEAPMASHLLYPQAGLDDGIHDHRRMGIEAGLAWGPVADATVVYCDRGITPGMAEGMLRATDENRPIERRSLPGWS